MQRKRVCSSCFHTRPKRNRISILYSLPEISGKIMEAGLKIRNAPSSKNTFADDFELAWVENEPFTGA